MNIVNNVATGISVNCFGLPNTQSQQLPASLPVGTKFTVSFGRAGAAFKLPNNVKYIDVIMGTNTPPDGSLRLEGPKAADGHDTYILFNFRKGNDGKMHFNVVYKSGSAPHLGNDGI